MPDAILAGVDEAGRGPLAGPVTVAAVILDPQRPVDGLDDSKKLTEKQREALYAEITDKALDYRIVAIPPKVIDKVNILQATLLGMRQSVEQLGTRPARVLIDGNRAPELDLPVETIVGGDALEPAISAASILAKVTRDRYMVEQHRIYPDYGFDRHKGYPTPYHLQVLARIGPCELHRRSYTPVHQSELAFK